tara:strand:- start:357 stop:527 length:171 start_codon:yes stop_codon:yes gene_type:complete
MNLFKDIIKFSDLEIGDKFGHKGKRYEVLDKNYTFIIAESNDDFTYYFVNESLIQN